MKLFIQTWHPTLLLLSSLIASIWLPLGNVALVLSFGYVVLITASKHFSQPDFHKEFADKLSEESNKITAEVAQLRNELNKIKEEHKTTKDDYNSFKAQANLKAANPMKRVF